MIRFMHEKTENVMAEHKLFCLFPRTRTPEGEWHLPAKCSLFEGACGSMSEPLADYGRKARTRAFSTDFLLVHQHT